MRLAAGPQAHIDFVKKTWVAAHTQSRENAQGFGVPSLWGRRPTMSIFNKHRATVPLSVAYAILALVATSGCKPSPICSTPTSAQCDSDCAQILTYRDDGGCYRDQDHFCIRQQIVSHVSQCVVDPSGDRIIVWARFGVEELLDQGWRVCTEEESRTFPSARCE